jgi:hypothetical protein
MEAVSYKNCDDDLPCLSYSSLFLFRSDIDEAFVTSFHQTVNQVGKKRQNITKNASSEV